jgi:hypothetical protein
VVVLEIKIEIKIEHVAVAKQKREPPVAVHPDRSPPLVCPLEQMMVVTGLLLLVAQS